jgi:hypothetical protein
MSRTIKAIERHMILPVRLGPRSRNSFRTRTSKVALGLRASVSCDDRRRGRLEGVMPGTIEAVATHSGNLTRVGSEPAKSVKDDRP